MAEEIQNQNSFGSTVRNALIFPAAIQGVGAVNSVRRAGSFKGAVDAMEIQKFKALNTKLKTTHKDVFSRGTALAENYEHYRGIYKKSTKLSKKAAKAAKKGKISLKDSFFNLFKADGAKTTVEGLQKASADAAKELGDVKKAVAQGKDVAHAAKSADAAKAVQKAQDALNGAQGAADVAKAQKALTKAEKSAAKIATQGVETGLKGTAKRLVKTELTSKFNLAMSALTTFLPAVQEKVIPAFKQEGFGAGVKELAKATARTATDFVSYGIGGALGRTLGTAIGTVICPGAGSAIGAMVGDAVGSMVVGGKICEKVDEVIGEKDKTTDQAQNPGQIKNAGAQNPVLDMQM